jgi:hypothetical protein
MSDPIIPTLTEGASKPLTSEELEQDRVGSGQDEDARSLEDEATERGEAATLSSLTMLPPG